MSFDTEVNTDAVREKTREVARSHKASWLQLGQFLFTIHQDKMFKVWGYLTFETYCIKELGLKQATAQKILKSYAFLEKEEPQVVDEKYAREEQPAVMPDYESVNLLRLAKNNEQITPQDFSDIRTAVLDEAREAKEVRKQIKQIVEENDPRDEEQILESKRRAMVKRLVSMLKNSEREFRHEKAIPQYLLEQMSDLSSKLEDQIAEA